MLAVGVDLPKDGLDVDGTLGQLLVARLLDGPGHELLETFR